MPELQKPSVGRMVHYVSYGTPGGEYESACRAAVVTAVHWSEADGPMTRMPELDLAVLNPEGMFFNRAVLQNETDKRGGTWHWPERHPE